MSSIRATVELPSWNAGKAAGFRAERPPLVRLALAAELPCLTVHGGYHTALADGLQLGLARRLQHVDGHAVHELGDAVGRRAPRGALSPSIALSSSRVPCTQATGLSSFSLRAMSSQWLDMLNSVEAS